eukprot:3841051-Amphidinium_carterae.1
MNLPLCSITLRLLDAAHKLFKSLSPTRAVELGVQIVCLIITTSYSSLRGAHRRKSLSLRALGGTALFV